MVERKILLIENQITQYRAIFAQLENAYTVLPLENDYVQFIDHVRVWVNKKYPEEARKVTAIGHIINLIESKDCELILMDYVLGGAFYCRTGINLARKINRMRIEQGKGILPVIFLSKMESNDKRVLRQYKRYETTFGNTDWIHKGYFGEELLASSYFKEHVLVKIEERLAGTPAVTHLRLTELNDLLKRNYILANTPGRAYNGDAKSYNKLSLLIKKLEDIPPTKEIDLEIDKILQTQADFGKPKFDYLLDYLNQKLNL